jgi:hypothetical protein
MGAAWRKRPAKRPTAAQRPERSNLGTPEVDSAIAQFGRQKHVVG